MKYALFIFLMFTGILTYPAIASPADTIGYKTIATIIKPGRMLVSSTEILRDTQALATYLSKSSTSANQLTEQTDFSSRLVIALAYNKGSRYHEFSQTVTTILTGDTVVVLLRRDSTAIDTSIRSQAAYCIQLISIAKTDKPIICRFNVPTLVTEKLKYIRQETLTRTIPGCSFDLMGRLFSNENAKRVPAVMVRRIYKKVALR